MGALYSLPHPHQRQHPHPPTHDHDRTTTPTHTQPRTDPHSLTRALVDRHTCIGELEHDLHTAFAAKRVPSESFVYVQDEAITSTLNEYDSTPNKTIPNRSLEWNG